MFWEVLKISAQYCYPSAKMEGKLTESLSDA